MQAVAATERPLKKVDSQTFDLPKGSKITVGTAAHIAEAPAVAAHCFKMM